MPSPLAYALSAGQPLVPSSKAQIAPTDVLGAYQMSTNQANQQYLAKLQQQNSLWGGLAGLGGSALTASILKGNLFGGGSQAPVDLGNALYNNGVMTGIEGVGPTAAGLGGGSPIAALGPSVGAGSGVPLAALAPPAADASAAAIPAAAAPTSLDLSSGIPASLSSLFGGTAAADAGAADAAGAAATDAAVGAPLDLAATAAAPAAADATGMTLADLLPFLFAA